VPIWPLLGSALQEVGKNIVLEFPLQLTVARNGQQYGPYEEEQVRSLLAQGSLSPSDLAWSEGMVDWRPLGHILLEQAPIASTQLRVAAPPPGQMLGGNLKGRVLSFDPVSRQGFISGNDGIRYWFDQSNWHAQRNPLPSLEVDFIADAQGRATQVFVEPNFTARVNMSKGVLALVCWFFGVLGAHRFLVGKVGSGVAQLILTLTVVGMVVSVPWVIVDFIMILSGNFADKNGNRIEEWW
jgi:TM2 domain-containing membrane protein YozV